MRRYLLLYSIVLFVPFAYNQASTTSGAVELDELSFDKITKKFKASLIKFDVAFPYGDKHEAFVALAKDAKDVDDLLIAQVGVKDYGEKENEALAKKYGATKDNFPVVKLFIKGQSNPIQFDDSNGFTTDELRRFVRQNTGLYLSLPGCVKELDKFASEFMKANKDNRKKILKKTEDFVQSSNEESSSVWYKTIMKKILEKGDEFVQSEFERIKKLLSGKISDEKKKELNIRNNILQSFQILENIKDKVQRRSNVPEIPRTKVTMGFVDLFMKFQEQLKDITATSPIDPLISNPRQWPKHKL